MKLTKISRKKRSGKHGYRARKATPGGRNVLKRRQTRGRKRLNVKSAGTNS